MRSAWSRRCTWRAFPTARLVRIAGSVIVRQRPGTAKGFVFLSMEDETGIMNAIVTPATFDRYKFEVLGEPYSDDRRRAAKSGWRDQREGGAGGRTTRGSGAGVARFSLRCAELLNGSSDHPSSQSRQALRFGPP